MKTHYTAKELAGMPGLPSNFVSVIRMADREAWPSQKRAGRGGGKEYALSALPVETQRHLQKLAGCAETLPTVKTAAAPPAVITPLPLPSELTGHQQTIMNARVFLVKSIESDMALGHRLQQSLEYVVGQIAAGNQPYFGQAELANDRKRKNGTALLSERSLMRFWSDWKKSGRNPVALAPNDGDVKRIQKESVLVAYVRDFGTRADTGQVPATVPAWMPYFLLAYRKPQSPSIPDALRDMKRTLPEHIELPNYHQVLRIVQKLPSVYIEKGRKTGAELKAIMGFNRRVWNEYHPFTCGQVDGHSFKAYVAHPTSGAHFHPEVCGIIDMTTKIMTGYSAGLAESSRTVADAFRHSCTVNATKSVGGRYKILEADLGSGNMAKVNADKEIGLFARVGTLLCPPEVAGNPQGHGGIERSNQSIWIRAAKELPTYTGKDMDRVTRKKVYTRLEQDLNAAKKAGEVGKVEKTSKLLLSWREFLAALEIWVAEYNNTPHRSLPKITDAAGKRRHRTPFEELAHRINEGWDPKSAHLEEDMIEYLFMPHERITVKRCEFRLHGNLYHSYALQTHHGEEMIAAYDIHDANQVYVLNQDERMICTAQWNGNNIHGVPTSKMEQADFERIEGQRKLKLKQLDMIENNRQRTVPTEHSENVQQEVLKIAQQIEEAEVVQASVFVLPPSERDRQYLWQELDAQIRNGETVQPEAAQFHKGWQNSDYFKAWQSIQEDLAGRTSATN